MKPWCFVVEVFLGHLGQETWGSGAVRIPTKLLTIDGPYGRHEHKARPLHLCQNIHTHTHTHTYRHTSHTHTHTLTDTHPTHTQTHTHTHTYRHTTHTHTHTYRHTSHTHTGHERLL